MIADVYRNSTTFPPIHIPVQAYYYLYLTCIVSTTTVAKTDMGFVSSSQAKGGSKTRNAENGVRFLTVAYY